MRSVSPNDDHAPLDEESLNVADDGVDHVDYREKCLASYSCIDANGELVKGVTTYEECVSGGMCLTTLVSKGKSWNGVAADGATVMMMDLMITLLISMMMLLLIVKIT